LLRFQGHEIAAVVIEHRQRADGRISVLLSLEVHLPELVGGFTLEPCCGLPATLPVQNQTMTQQDAMHGDDRQHGTFTLQQHSQLAGAPVRSLPAKLHDPRLNHTRSLVRTRQRAAAAFRYPCHALFAEPPEPQIAGRTSDLVLPTQTTQALATAGTKHELHTLIQHALATPSHPKHLARCKGSTDNDV
jgi:hypothetical protein